MLFETFSRRMKIVLICLIVAVALFLGFITLLAIDYPYIYHNDESQIWKQITVLAIFLIVSIVAQILIVCRAAKEQEILRSTTDSKIAALEARIAELEKQK